MKPFRPLFLFLLGWLAIGAVTSVPVFSPIAMAPITWVPNVTEGDTNRPSIWNTDGLTYGMGWGDGHFSTCDATGGQFWHMIWGKWAYTYSTNVLSFTLVNCMPGFLNTVTTTACHAIGSFTSSAGDDGFSRGGDVYQFIGCQGGPATFATVAMYMIMSPHTDSPVGTHWCNWARFKAGSVASGANTCDANNWQTTGDPCTDVNMTLSDFTGGTNTYSCVPFNWAGSGTLRIPQRYARVQIYQDGGTAPTITGASPATCEYFISNVPLGVDNVTHGMYATRHCALTTQTDIMNLPAKLEYWDGAVWKFYSTATGGIPLTSEAANIIPSAWGSDSVYSQTAFYSADMKVFVLSGDNSTADGLHNAYGTLPQGSFTPLANATAPTIPAPTGYSTYMLSTYTALGDGFRITKVYGGSPADVPPNPGYTPVAGTNWMRPPNIRAGAGTQ